MVLVWSMAESPCRQPRDADDDLPALVESLLESYRSDARGHHINRRYLPSRSEIIAVIHRLLDVLFPGYFGRQDLTDANLPYHLGVTLSEVRERMSTQVCLCLCYQRELEGTAPDSTAEHRHDARALCTRFLRQLPRIRELLLTDVQAAFEGDPAATNLDEIILAYPGLLAVAVYRLAHELHLLHVPLMPRIMTEWAHAQTGADIHPGAHVGPSFFIDHATGVVIGETSRIGKNVKLYQGVTLGALSHPRDERGRVIRGTKRHPTVEDDATLYANSTVLGGDTIVGSSSVIGGSVFLTQSVPPHARVATKLPELRVRQAHGDDPRSLEHLVDLPEPRTLDPDAAQ